MLFLSLSRLCKIAIEHILYGESLAYGNEREELTKLICKVNHFSSNSNTTEVKMIDLYVYFPK